ncbi:hypothetical protein B566_EDAN011279, partial [Ephemera danica]
MRNGQTASRHIEKSKPLKNLHVIALLGPDTAPREVMPPEAPTGVLFEDDDPDMQAVVGEQKTEETATTVTETKVTEPKEKQPYRMRIVWRNVILLSYLHLVALYGVYLIFTSAKLLTTAY